MTYGLFAFPFAKRVVVREWSMSPTLVPDEHVLIDRLAYWTGEPRRDDIVLARHPHRPRISSLKRIAAVPGDRVRYDRNGIWVNGEQYRQDEGSGSSEAVEGEYRLGAEQYFLLGDAISTDSRQSGPVQRRGIIGKAWLVYWPLKAYRKL